MRFHVMWANLIFSFLISFCCLNDALALLQSSSPTRPVDCALVMDISGQRLYCGDKTNGILFHSTDGGLSWSYNASLPRIPWAALVSDAQGHKFIGLTRLDEGDHNRLMQSSDDGVTWSSRPPSQLRGAPQMTPSMSALASDASGTYLFSVGSDAAGSVFLSNDSGSSWSAASSLPLTSWSTVVCDDEGMTALASSSDGIYQSTDRGSSWRLADAPDVPWIGLSVSKSGKSAFAIAAGRGRKDEDNGGIFISEDSGAHWTELPAPEGIRWQMIASDATGNTVVAAGLRDEDGPRTHSQKSAATEGSVWISRDRGKTWFMGLSLPSNSRLAFSSLVVSGTGDVIVLSSSAGLYRSSDSGISFVSLSTPDATPNPAANSDNGKDSSSSKSSAMVIIVAVVIPVVVIVAALIVFFRYPHLLQVNFKLSLPSFSLPSFSLGIGGKVLPLPLLDPSDSSRSIFVTDCYLTHDIGSDELGRDTRTRVTAINAYLKARGLITWFYEERTTNNFYKISEGLDNAAIVLVFVTKRYQSQVNSSDDTDSLRYEFSYALENKGSQMMIPIVMEPGMRNNKEWQQSLNKGLGGEPIIDMAEEGLPRAHLSKEDKKKTLLRFANKCEELVERIQAAIEKNCQKKVELNQLSPADAVTIAAAAASTANKIMQTRDPTTIGEDM